MKVKKLSIILSVCVIAVLSFGFIKGLNISSSSPINYMDVSWNYSFKDINELTDKSDLIALVKITGVNKEFQQDDIDFTEYNATVEQPIANSTINQNIILYMTGVNNSTRHFEVKDDPLPNKGDKFLIFAKKNSDGTYSILGGPQGRLSYKDGKINSLNHITDRVGINNINIYNEDFLQLKQQIQEHKKN